jgi:hypothetical protein
MYSIQLIKRIYSERTEVESAQVAIIRKELSLPFAPSKGLQIYAPPFNESLNSCIYNKDSGFTCKFADQFLKEKIYEGYLEENFDFSFFFDELLNFYPEQGWITEIMENPTYDPEPLSTEEKIEDQVKKLCVTGRLNYTHRIQTIMALITEIAGNKISLDDALKKEEESSRRVSSWRWRLNFLIPAALLLTLLPVVGYLGVGLLAVFLAIYLDCNSHHQTNLLQLSIAFDCFCDAQTRWEIATGYELRDELLEVIHADALGELSYFDGTWEAEVLKLKREAFWEIYKTTSPLP